MKTTISLTEYHAIAISRVIEDLFSPWQLVT